ncbi:hypothetical protein BELL_0678g00080 [Botrytis elliptica]|uniref:Uncharacterized protein n=1 Tax=Botrytis elliptica TaxID=278938 RepID=A0A4Z1JGQ1_9HELO|nr:hypothetical protein BELL_0678g00080 [Botrytis elliptica]
MGHGTTIPPNSYFPRLPKLGLVELSEYVDETYSGLLLTKQVNNINNQAFKVSVHVTIDGKSRRQFHKDIKANANANAILYKSADHRADPSRTGTG